MLGCDWLDTSSQSSDFVEQSSARVLHLEFFCCSREADLVSARVSLHLSKQDVKSPSRALVILIAHHHPLTTLVPITFSTYLRPIPPLTPAIALLLTDPHG